ncbi:MAG: outer membrane protein assembly factor BamE [Alphaproteobacteria bacterium]|jgi:outer membrane protein assembly factor BamE (lipoprotein component of BamABCDE complex)|nr:outer membrane protein assembly factor BamE [Alphaproteobacteria bacterium]
MARRAILAGAALAALTAGCIKPTQSYHGYIVDEAQPKQMEPGVDTRASVLASLGTPSTKSIFDDNTWFYITTQHERLAFLRDKVAERTIVAIRFGEDDKVEDVLTYDAKDGQVINYAQRETPTLGRQLSLIEQLLGSVGNVALPRTNEATPSNPTGRR